MITFEGMETLRGVATDLYPVDEGGPYVEWDFWIGKDDGNFYINRWTKPMTDGHRGVNGQMISDCGLRDGVDFFCGYLDELGIKYEIFLGRHGLGYSVRRKS